MHKSSVQNGALITSLSPKMSSHVSAGQFQPVCLGQGLALSQDWRGTTHHHQQQTPARSGGELHPGPSSRIGEGVHCPSEHTPQGFGTLGRSPWRGQVPAQALQHPWNK